MKGNPLKQPNLGPSFGVQIAPLDANLLAVDMQNDPVGWIETNKTSSGEGDVRPLARRGIQLRQRIQKFPPRTGEPGQPVIHSARPEHRP